jgi:hypothetical protein
MSEKMAYLNQAKSDFGRLRKKEIIARILGLLKAQKDEMLSLGEVRSLLRPSTEHYRGLKAVPLSRIVGSEGRYKDFNKAFLPRHDRLMGRWTRVDVAHYEDVILPPVKLFEIGGVYFVRDGNHRVSVAKAKRAEFIDAEVVSLASVIAIHPDMDRDDLKKAVIEFERRKFFEETGLDAKRPGCSLTFSEVGRYEEIKEHVLEHKWYMNLKKTEEIPFEVALLSWYDTVYMPIVRIIREEKLLSRFPNETESDLYVFIGKHWGELSRRYGALFTLEEAAEDLSKQPHPRGIARLLAAILRIFKGGRKEKTRRAAGGRG